jgi:hypothetical protein
MAICSLIPLNLPTCLPRPHTIPPLRPATHLPARRLQVSTRRHLQRLLRPHQRSRQRYEFCPRARLVSVFFVEAQRFFVQLRLASGLKVRFLSSDEDQQVKAVKALHKMISTGGFKGLNAVIQCGVVAEISSSGLLSPHWNVRAPCAAFLMSFLTVCWSSKQMSSEMMTSLFPKVSSSPYPEVSMVVDHAKVLHASTIGSNPCHTTEPLVRMVPSAAPLTDLFGPCAQSENALIQCYTPPPPHSSNHSP